jgi:hypothetical protein
MTTQHRRRTSWTARPSPQHVFAQGRSLTLRVTTLTESPASPSAPLAHSTSSTLIERTFRPGFLTFLTGSALQTEFAVTHSKQTTQEFLTGARTHIRIFEILQISAQNLAALDPQSHAGFVNFTALLPGSAQKVESDVTYSKQMTDKFLPGARTAIRLSKIRQLRTQKFTRRGELARVKLRKRYVIHRFNIFLTETAQHSEFAVTHSKQSTGAFLTETRIGYLGPGRFGGFASLAHGNSSNIDTKLSEGCAWLRQ